jgi:MYXO-CTERM domain-containing protein
MKRCKGFLFISMAIALASATLSAPAEAHWCDDLWASSYNIVVRPESDTVTGGSMNVYVQNNMGYQLINFKLTASAGSAALTVTAPTLKVANTLLPGQKAIWKISGNGFTKIEDVAFSVSFGNAGQTNCYPTKSAKAVMVVKTDGTLYPAPPALPGLDSPASPSGCVGGLDQARSLQYQAMADFEDANAGLDKLMTLYCAGRGSFGSTDGVSMANCKDNSSTTCPTSKPAAKTGSKYDYMHLWAAGELAARKSVLGTTRIATLRQRLRCGVNDGDVGFGGYALFMLGYLGEDADARTFIQSQISGTGDMAAIAKAALLLMGSAADMTTYKADVQAGLKSSSTFVAAACAAALGIAAKDDTAVTGTLIPLVKWNEPDTAQEDGQGLYAGHLLALVAWDRRQWAANGGDKGAITFYGDVATGTGGVTGTGGATIGAGGAVASGGTTGGGGNRDASPVSDAKAGGDASANGGAVSSGGNGNAGASGAAGAGGVVASGGSVTTGGGDKGSGGGIGGKSANSSGNGGDSGSGSSTAGGASGKTSTSSGCSFALGGRTPSAPAALLLLAVVGLATRRRRS